MLTEETVSLQKKLSSIAHCPKQVVHDNPEYDCNFDSDCDKCPNNKHSLCTTIVQEAVRASAKNIEDYVFDLNVNFKKGTKDNPNYINGKIDGLEWAKKLLVGSPSPVTGTGDSPSPSTKCFNNKCWNNDQTKHECRQYYCRIKECDGYKPEKESSEAKK